MKINLSSSSSSSYPLLLSDERILIITMTITHMNLDQLAWYVASDAAYYTFPSNDRAIDC